MRIEPLNEADHLAAATALLVEAMPWEPVAPVASEKLFGDNGARAGVALGAFDDAGALVGVLAQAGRWIKVLAVLPDVRGQRVGSRLLDAAAAHAAEVAPGAPLRLIDHPGNYLAPGVDVRNTGGIAFAERRGFRIIGEVENLRVPLDNNPLVTQARIDELEARAGDRGYTVFRAEAEHATALHDWVTASFHGVWAFEVARAMQGPRAVVHVAVHGDGVPVAFACADGNNQGLGWFGPTGTDAAHRGRGLGEILLLRCLLDVKGLPDGGVIAWIGPRDFYQRVAGAKADRRFLTFERPVA